jgi:phage gp46-like protein
MDVQLFTGCEQNSCFDIGVICGDLATENTLLTALMVSLFTDRRSWDNDELPKTQDDKRGWWGDALDGFFWGSRLWLLESSKSTSDVPELAIGYVREATDWLVEDGLADKVLIEAEYVADCTGALCKDQLGISVTLCRPRDNDLNFKFRYAWQNQVVSDCEYTGCEVVYNDYCASYPMLCGGYGFLATDRRDPAATVKISSCDGAAPDVWIYPTAGDNWQYKVTDSNGIVGYAVNQSRCKVDCE